MERITVTVPEAIALSGIGRSSLYKLFHEGKLTPRKSGTRTLILVAELKNFLRSLPQGSSQSRFEKYGSVGSSTKPEVV
jgi:hypothetical protein